MAAPAKVKHRRKTSLTPPLPRTPGQKGEAYCCVEPSTVTALAPGGKDCFPVVSKKLPRFHDRKLISSTEQLPPSDEEPIMQHHRLAGY